ncbi:lasso peptide biosynthesis B2 protein [Asticcacaulis sp.]|uniref:lasso peptide biosynthesis B2 protein n=1 Tax=Asticcacaulis sp. TaxID=1872648 RepID=UPI002CDDEE53|nr:lasso peptide biosynthesis B2 protein [Asticcacaulis sp.]HTM81567.1 lasso peptide biosynthesis B2 protein [Asticcacaulis sp.]
MNIQIQPNLLWCRANDRAVFLNLTNQRYFMLQPVQATSFEKWCAGETLSAEEVDTLSMIITDRPMPKNDWRQQLQPPTHFPSPVSSSCDFPAASPYPWLVPMAFVCHGMARIGLKMAPFSSLMRRLHDRKQTRQHVSIRWELDRAAATFALTTRLLRSSDRCLQTSVALTLFLAKLGHFPDLVLGVKTAPWAAHAWVQKGILVLNDEADRVRAFAPILVI